MRWFKCLTDRSPAMGRIHNTFGYEGVGMAFVFLNAVHDTCVESVSPDDVCRWLKIQHRRAEKLMPFLMEIWEEFDQILDKKRPKNDQKMTKKWVKNDQKMVKKFASNPGPDRTPYKEREKERNNTPLPPKGEGEGFGKNVVDLGQEANQAARSQTRGGHGRAETVQSQPFNLFWAEYPRKVAKSTAEHAWRSKQLNPRFDEIMAGLKRYKASEQWQRENGRFIPHPTTWLNQERWTDEVELSKTPSPYWQRLKEARFVMDIYTGKQYDLDNYEPDSVKLYFVNQFDPLDRLEIRALRVEGGSKLVELK